MTVVALASTKAAPGVSTTVLALAAVWPADRALLLVEADADGGDLAARFDLPADPGLTGVATSSRRQLTAAELDRSTQTLPGGTGVLLAPSDAEEATRALTLAAAPLAETLAGLDDRDVLIDLGRLRPESPATPLAAQAEVVLLVARPQVAELRHLPPRARALTADGGARPALAVVGERPYPPGEIAAALGLPLAGTLADDPRAAGGPAPGGRTRALCGHQ